MTITIERHRSIVEIAMILGLSPCFTEPKIAVGRVSNTRPFNKVGDDEIIEADNKGQQEA